MADKFPPLVCFSTLKIDSSALPLLKVNEISAVWRHSGKKLVADPKSRRKKKKGTIYH